MHMKLLLSALFAAGSAHAHQMMTNLHIDGVDQGDGTCVRVPPNTNPIVELRGPSMACNVGGEKAVDRTCNVKAGSKITFEWRTWPDGSVKRPIDESHQGPCAVYMKRVDKGGSAAGTGWFKIWEDGYHDGNFCTQRLIDNGGMMTATVPKDLAAGGYLIRAESWALHHAQDIGGAQVYIGCGQIFVTSTGGNQTPRGISIPGYASPTDPGVHFNYWGNQHLSNYIIPGPAVYVPTNSGGGGTIGTVPKAPECLVRNANWCAKPVPGFNSEAECWESSQNCLDQLDACYRSAPATGSKGCHQWEKVCQSYQSHCTACGRDCKGSFPPISASTTKEKRQIDLGGLPGKALTIVQPFCQSIADFCVADAKVCLKTRPPVFCDNYDKTCDDFRRLCAGQISLKTLPDFPIADVAKQCNWLGGKVCGANAGCKSQMGGLCGSLPANILPIKFPGQ